LTRLRFFADHCVSNFIVETLRDAGHEVFQLKAYVPTDSPDQVVISKAQELDSILVSLDRDFADIVTHPPADYKGIVSLQVRNHPEIVPKLVARMKDYLSDNPHMNHYKGKLFLVEVHRIRVCE
jgi:predicted nuclease of predicted toxin-antitoxin system